MALGAKVVAENVKQNFSRNVGEIELHHLLYAGAFCIIQIGLWNQYLGIKCHKKFFFFVNGVEAK